MYFLLIVSLIKPQRVRYVCSYSPILIDRILPLIFFYTDSNKNQTTQAKNTYQLKHINTHIYFFSCKQMRHTFVYIIKLNMCSVNLLSIKIYYTFKLFIQLT